MTMILFNSVSWIGVLLCALAGSFTIDRQCLVPHWLYKLSFAGMALFLGWGAVFGDDNGWAAWPPHFGLVIALDFFLFLRVLRYAVMFRRCYGHLPLMVDGGKVGT